VPKYPWHIEQLAPEIRSLIPAMVSLPMRFAQTPVLQPIEMVECRVHGIQVGAQYVASDLKTLRPVPPPRRKGSGHAR